MSVDTAIINSKVVTSQGIFSAGIAIDGEKIVVIARDDDLPQANTVIDAEGNYVLPGLVDAHCHFGRRADVTLATSIKTETQAYAFGGVTTALQMQVGPESLANGAKDFIAVWEENAYIDLGLTTEIISKHNIGEIRGLADDLGIVGCKLQPCYKGVEPHPGPAGIPAIDEGIIYSTLEEVGKLVQEGYKVHCRVHCEFIDIYLNLKEKAIEQGVEPHSWHEIRPSFIEEETMQRFMYLANLVGCPLYIVHMTIKEGVDIISKARGESINVMAETCPQYLVLNVDNTDRVLSKVNPPLRTKEDNQRLWEGIRDGVISVVGTDHSMVRRRDKLDLWTAAPGIASAESWLSIMLSEGVNKGRISLEKLVEVCCSNPAKIYGLFPKKGVIAVGSDADLTLVDLNKHVVVSEKPRYSTADFSLYTGFKLQGWPVLTMLRGNVIMEQGKVIGKSGLGRYMPGKTK